MNRIKEFLINRKQTVVIEGYKTFRVTAVQLVNLLPPGTGSITLSSFKQSLANSWSSVQIHDQVHTKVSM